MKFLSQYKNGFLVLSAAMLVLYGCGRHDAKDERSNQEATVLKQPATTEAYSEQQSDHAVQQDVYYDCCNQNRAIAEQALWCKGNAYWNKLKTKKGSNDDEGKGDFITGYQSGVMDVQNAHSFDDSKFTHSEYGEKGYKKGYKTALKRLGVMDYDCSGKLSGYRKIWCATVRIYDGIYSHEKNNAILKNRFIAGYFSGRAVAFSLTEESDRIIRKNVDPETLLAEVIGNTEQGSPVEKVFYRGFKEGFLHMVEKMRIEIEKVLQNLPRAP